MKNNKIKNIAPAVTLIILAPLVAEILPGATRFSSLFVLPIEICVWGGGALLIRYMVRKWQLSWNGMLFLALALSVAEEFLIQQTSVAPMVIQLKGVTYARVWGINYIYLLWALIYEPIFVVFLPIYLTELIFPNRSKDLWISRGGIFLFTTLFLLGSFMAWYSWTQIARPNVFHVPTYNPPFVMIVVAAALISFFIWFATKSIKEKITQPINSPRLWTIGFMGGLWAIFLYGIVLLAFGILPSFPPLVAIASGLLLVTAAIYLLPHWANSLYWSPMHDFVMIFGIISGSISVGFIGFIGAAPINLYFKIFIDVFALIFMIGLGLRVKKQLRVLH